MMSNLIDPLDRLNYYNGERLEASDLRLEQEYHIRVRRLLNQALHTYGIAAGLEVLPVQGDVHKVHINHGLALDEDGREIILLEDVEILASGVPSAVEGVVLGNYLTIRYGEAPVAVTEESCCSPLENKNRLAWGGPTRLRAAPIIEWQNTWPPPGSGRIVLAQVELDKNCGVRNIRTGVRKYVAISQPPRTLSYALEGEKDIDSKNSKRLGFHIRGGRPESVLLCLRAEVFSTLYYTELGRHDHNIYLTTTDSSTHTHGVSLGSLTTTEDGDHSHDATANVEDPDDHDALEMHSADIYDANLNIVNLKILASGKHTHTIDTQSATSDSGGVHKHFLDGSTGKTGQSISARTGSPFTYVDDLHILLDGTDVTTEICSRLNLTKLGDGTATHRIAQTNLPPIEIQLDTLGVDLAEGFHVTELKVNKGGGKIAYNLYVE